MHRFCFASLLLVLFAHAVSAAEPQKPNIILILADDFGYECVGANGGTSYETPHLDRLAASGVRFTKAFAQPLCTPTRAQLMTGQYNVRNYVQFGLLEKSQTTFAHLFKQAGYATGIVGKWQLGRESDLPKHFGFDEYCLWQLTRRPGRYKNPGLEINGQEFDYTNGEYGPDIVNDYAIDFVTRKKNESFLLYYPMMLTHSPYDATPDSDDYDEAKAKAKKADKKADKKARKDADSPTPRHFVDMVEYMDKLIGKLVARLDDLKIHDNTLIVFFGDNGTGKGTKSKMGDKIIVGGKGSTIDTGMHVPMIVNWPKVITTGRVCHDLADSTDILPTICEAANITPPKNLLWDGRSVLSQCRGEKGRPREWLYCWYAQGGGKVADKEFARNHDYKLYRDGSFFDIRAGDMDDKLIDAAASRLDPQAATIRKSLQAVLDQFQDARPAHIANHAKRAAAGE